MEYRKSMVENQSGSELKDISNIAVGGQAADNESQTQRSGRLRLPAASNRDSANRAALIRWASPNVLGCLVSVGLIALLFYGLNHTVNENTETIDLINALFFFGTLIVAFTVLLLRNFARILDKWRMWADIAIIERESRSLREREIPSESLTSSLSSLSDFLLKHSTSSGVVAPPTGFYESQLKRRIDITFSCISEALYRRYWDARKRIPDSDSSSRSSLRSHREFGYSTLGSWMNDLREHLMGTRKWFRTSSKEISTLLYFFEDWQAFFKLLHQDIFKEHADAVNKFHDRQEETLENAARRKKELIFELARQVFVGVLLLVIGYFLGAMD